MTKITKRTVDGLQPQAGRDVFAWDAELRGFGIRVKPSGVKTYLIQYRNAEGRTRRLVLGQHGVLAPEQAREFARQKLAAAARGEDPSAERHAAREGMTVAEVCDWYLEQARAGRILGRKRKPIKASTLDSDESRIDSHIKPLIGSRTARGLTLRDIEAMQADIMEGKSAKGRKGRGGRTTGGAGVAGRTVGTLRSILGHALRLELIERNPAAGVRQVAGNQKKRRLSEEELQLLGRTMRECEEEGEHPTGLAAIRLLLLTGFRRMEALALERAWINTRRSYVSFPDTKGGEQVRAIGKAAVACITEQMRVSMGWPYLFPADWGEGHFVGVVRVLDRVCARAGLTQVTPHTLRHTFASVAGDLNFSELTIKGLLGHAPRGVTQGYVHLDVALVVAADQVAARMAELLDGPRAKTAKTKRGTTRRGFAKAA
ncbi:tyrosine-type recombinase/integrase [Propylenella binzhouense]|uniref:DUF4102 domain-containing protein n=1 Tax=Propylenella binzhouense TaxID=2555902 RepID=A0A964WRV8_9HYPH|nr:site-specific integrase [Propylenella binzhouense]MYZ46323.1 DUF4102 domain-containing protein [Propylenella binzhouense]